VRRLEQDVGGLTSLDPYVRDGGVVQSVPLTVSMADPVEEKALHMVNADPNRTPTFTMFGNADFFFTTSNPCTGIPVCVNPAFAWNHGDVQEEIGNTWLGVVGPGIEKRQVDSTTWTDHTNVRPTVLALAGLSDDYTEDGRVLVEALRHNAVPPALQGSHIRALMDAYEQVNASFGQFATDTLTASTKALETTDNTKYTSIEDAITSLTNQRDVLVAQIRAALNAAAFNGTPISDSQADSWTSQAQSLIDQAHQLAITS
jgi:hypothetical protein